MPEARLERTRAAYRCGRSFVIVPWEHCDCGGCEFARRLEAAMRAGVSSLDAFDWLVTQYPDSARADMIAARCGADQC